LTIYLLYYQSYSESVFFPNAFLSPHVAESSCYLRSSFTRLKSTVCNAKIYHEITSLQCKYVQIMICLPRQLAILSTHYSLNWVIPVSCCSFCRSWPCLWNMMSFSKNGLRDRENNWFLRNLFFRQDIFARLQEWLKWQNVKEHGRWSLCNLLRLHSIMSSDKLVDSILSHQKAVYIHYRP
jgi:hypothetical protein